MELPISLYEDKKSFTLSIDQFKHLTTKVIVDTILNPKEHVVFKFFKDSRVVRVYRGPLVINQFDYELDHVDEFEFSQFYLSSRDCDKWCKFFRSVNPYKASEKLPSIIFIIKVDDKIVLYESFNSDSVLYCNQIELEPFKEVNIKDDYENYVEDPSIPVIKSEFSNSLKNNEKESVVEQMETDEFDISISNEEVKKKSYKKKKKMKN